MTILKKYNDQTQKEIQRIELTGEEKTDYETFCLKITKCFDKSIYLFSDVLSVTTLIIKELLVD